MMPMLRSEELDAVMRIMECAFDPYWREAWTRAQIAQSLAFPSTHLVLVGPTAALCEAGEAAVAFTLSRHVMDEEELLLIAVDPDYRGRGIGAQLLDRLGRRSAARGATRLFLEMRANNPAESLYRRHGFEQIGRRPDYYRSLSGERIDAITFARNLDHL